MSTTTRSRSSTSADFGWLNDEARTFLRRGYLLEGTGPEDRVREIAEHAEGLLEMDGFADRFYEYMARGYYSLASPVWANFGLDRGLPISCFGSYIDDSMEAILDTHAEVGMMTKVGGGTSGYFGDVRPRGASITNNGTSNGTYPFAQLFDKIINVVSQGETRRGHFAGYIDIEHPDVEEWLNIQTEGDAIQTMMYGVVVGDDWMEAMIDGDSDKRALWAKVVESRMNLGIPYILFRGNVQDGRPQVYKDKGYDVHASNLCSEVLLPSGPDESFVCCLSSMNALHYDDWKDTDAVETLTQFLDAVMQEFIDGAKGMAHMDRAVRFAERHRAIGIGILGWHSYLQSNRIPFESAEASLTGAEIAKTIKERSYAASAELADRFGEPPVLEGYGRRNATTMAVAPTKSSSFILGQVSPSIEPIKSNYFVQDRAKMKVTYKNPHLKALLQEKGRDTDAVWDEIALRDGSVQHLDFLSDEEKDVFKTFSEISQMAIIDQAAGRQKHIDQSQSLNLAIDPGSTPVKDINRLYVEAWKKGVKSLYYQHGVNAAQSFSRDLLACKACEA
ncbi:MULTISPECIES: ribonucleoside-diphosphate reductase subunit alpha [Salinibacter]|uniref:Ribonucleoside-diphosphate reductase n=1 Tax=Salinibacter ruber TaxID=146919 RepID=A0A9X2Q784_9BACT|nr:MULTISPECIES: ribonucleoside-diphosphate reductase subunit alpha [Salinibacter]MCS3639061.1 ribonucleoside-diphosphate reductase alpha chain [Salinibacter ruber]MCS3661699.1 ribonucleoside-diphosphate reductase alpha chain [Salinibacter ruber]MCS3672126.1 ribonucleoside-diphosphate reductase alpha chain [Salinibacter ruber]MCS3685117.1 ribonucleoside-diphosphate reductase alpha chain [Salinibacter ruber]MCS3700267.1 ribonucleoside-diphosphate reductase alpha chain [Salinibacter ruber]